MTEQKLDLTMRENYAVRAAYSQYLNFSPRFVTAEMVNDLARDCGISTEDVANDLVAVFLIGVLKLNAHILFVVVLGKSS